MMLKRMLLFALVATWLVACESSGSGGSTNTTGPETKPAEDMSLSDEWLEDRDTLPELDGSGEWRDNSVVDAQAIKNYVLEPVMQMNRRMGQATYNSSVLNKLVEEIEAGAKKEARELYEALFNNISDGNHIRYQKQLKCLADVHEIELELQSLLVAVHDPELREGVFKPAVLEELAAMGTEEERMGYLIEQLWLEESGRSDLIRIWERYRNKIAAFLVLPFGDEEVYSNAWSCSLTNESWEQFAEGPTFVSEVQDQWNIWRGDGEPITRNNMAAEISSLVELVNTVRNSTEINSFNLGSMNQVLLASGLAEEPEETDDSHEGSLYRMAKLVCKGFWGAEDTEALCTEGDESFVGTFQITRDVNEQVASNAANALRWIAYDGALARELHKRYAKPNKPTEAEDRKAQPLVDAIVTLKQKFLDPLAQRAWQTLPNPPETTGGTGGCQATGLCNRSLLISVAHAVDGGMDVSEKKPGYNMGSGKTALPIDANNENVLRHDRVEYVMRELDKGVVDYLEEVDGAVDELLGAWNHLITLLLITFGALRLRSRRLA